MGSQCLLPEATGSEVEHIYDGSLVNHRATQRQPKQKHSHSLSQPHFICTATEEYASGEHAKITHSVSVATKL